MKTDNEKIQNYIGFLRCPMCESNFKHRDNQLKCENNHTFDFSGSGYVNFLNKPVHHHYEKELFKSRNITAQSGLFNILESALSELISSLIEDKKEITILDAGSGEGAIFVNVLSHLNNKKINGIGIDIAKEGISIASKKYKSQMWLVADISCLPIDSHSIDIVLNTLSPANYAEFKRVLKADGYLIKTIPDENYLLELRQLFSKKSYSNRKIIEHFCKNYELTEKIRVSYKKHPENEIKSALVKMTPLGWHQEINELQIAEINEISMDFCVLKGNSVIKN